MIDKNKDAALARAEERVKRLEDALRYVLSHGWTDVHIGSKLNRLEMVVSDCRRRELHDALEVLP